jgi:hypothetical protein
MQEMHCFQGHSNLPVDPLDLARHLIPRFDWQEGPHILSCNGNALRSAHLRDYGVGARTLILLHLTIFVCLGLGWWHSPCDLQCVKPRVWRTFPKIKGPNPRPFLFLGIVAPPHTHLRALSYLLLPLFTPFFLWLWPPEIWQKFCQRRI